MGSIQTWTWILVGMTFSVYIGIAIWAKARSTGDFYVASKQVHPVLNGMATGADWMSAASFISMAGLISFMGRSGSMYLMGWTGGYVLLAMLLAPYLRKYGKYTVPMFIGERYYSNTARVVAVICAIFVSFTYVAGQMRGVGVVFSRFLEVPINTGVVIGMAIVFFYAVMGGMKGITYTQVAQYCVLIVAYLIPAIFISLNMTGNPVPQIAFGGELKDGGGYLLAHLDALSTDLGFSQYTGAGTKSTIDVFMITVALMVGTAGLPHVIIRFFTTPTIRGARASAGWALLFITILYTTAPAVAAFARVNLIETLNVTMENGLKGDVKYKDVPQWFKSWESAELIAWVDKNGDGKIKYVKGEAYVNKKKPIFLKEGAIIEYKADAIGEKAIAAQKKQMARYAQLLGTTADDFKSKGTITVTKEQAVGMSGEKVVANTLIPIKPADFDTLSDDEKKKYSDNEVYIDRDIMVLANPEIAGLPNWVIALVAAGGLAAALSTAAGLLLVIAASVSHDLVKNVISPGISEKNELLIARIAAGGAVCVAGLFGIYPPGFVAQVVAFAFGLAASSFFPAIILGVFWKRTNREGAIAGMATGITFTAAYIIYFKFVNPTANKEENWLWAISPEGIGAIGMVLNFVVTVAVSKFTPAPPQEVQDMVESLRYPRAM